MSATPYDEVAYPSQPFLRTHPRRLAVPAALFGLTFKPVDGARVLEIGCGEGGNLIPMALAYPQAEFLGFDLAATAIAAGRAVVDDLGLRNIRLETRDILQPGADLGEFDYIISHGVYSWVPEPVRKALLGLIQTCLAPDGLAFVSYNALPGCHLRIMIREMVMHHLRGIEGFDNRVAGARQFLQLYIDNAPNEDPTAFTIKTYCRAMLDRDPRVLFHDELGPVYAPFYLHEFVREAEAHGLQFLAESEGHWWREELFPSSRGRAIIAAVGSDPADVHQYLDFLTARLFRQTIVCRAERAVDRTVDYDRIRKLWVAGSVRTADPDPDLTSRASVRFELPGGAAIGLDDPNLKQALYQIGKAWPRAIAVSDLPDDPEVSEGLLQLFTAGHLDLTAGPTPGPDAAGERPRASPLALRQLSQGLSVLCSLDHATVSFEDEASRAFLQLLDGARTREELAEALTKQGHEPDAATAIVKAQLEGLASLGLLVG